MARKVKVYMGSLKNKKFRLKKALATFGLATSIVCTLAGCGRNSDYDFSFDKPLKNNTSYESTSTTNTNTQNTNTTYKAPAIEYSTLDFDKMLYSTEANNYFINYLSSLGTVKYDYSELFNVEKALELYEKEDLSNVKHSHDFLKGGKTVDVDELYEVVVANNKEYLKNHKVSLYKDLSKKELTKILTIVADTVNQYIKDHPDMDLSSLSCTLGDLKVFEKTSTVNAYVSDDGVLAINPPMLNILIKQYQNKGIDAYKNTVMHETIHLIQRMCADERNRRLCRYVS